MYLYIQRRASKRGAGGTNQGGANNRCGGKKNQDRKCEAGQHTQERDYKIKWEIK